MNWKDFCDIQDKAYGENNWTFDATKRESERIERLRTKGGTEAQWMAVFDRIAARNPEIKRIVRLCL